MNWDAIGAIGEIIGAAAVVFSLVYLATQIRMSNRASRQSAEQTLFDSQRIWLGRIAENDVLSDIWMRGAKNDLTLTESEWVRYGALCNEITLNWERNYFLEKDGDISTAMIERDRRLRRLIVGAPGYQKWFDARKVTLTVEFCSLIEEEIARFETYTVPYATDSADAPET